jgi:hypothetical protein
MVESASGYLYPVPVEPVVGVNGGAIEGPEPDGKAMTAKAAAALVQKDVG